MASSWTWSQPHNDYYITTQDQYGNIVYLWSKDQQPQAGAAVPPADSTHRPRTDSGLVDDPVSVAPEIRAQLHHTGFIQGTPERGWTESLDPSYLMRSGRDAYNFFRLGKVFATLFIQAASANAIPGDSITVVKFGEHAFSQIRRFVIVDVRHGFVYACPITTYNNRATLKPGCIPSQHSAVYLDGQQPILLPGEYLEKEAIRINRADASIQMNPASRLHYSKAYPVEMNVKVKDIGDVDPNDLSNLVRYYRKENGFPDQ